MLGVLLFGFLYCLPLLISLVVGWIMTRAYWREYGELSVGDGIWVVLWFVGSWVPLVNIITAVVLLYESNQKFEWSSRSLIKSRERQHEETVSALRGDH